MLQAAPAEVERFPSGRLDRWLPMMLAFFDLLSLGHDAPVERTQDDLRDPAYRQAFLSRLGAGGSACRPVAAVPPRPLRLDAG